MSGTYFYIKFNNRELSTNGGVPDSIHPWLGAFCD